MNFKPLVQDLYGRGDERRRVAAEKLHQHGEPGNELALETVIQILQQDTTPLRWAAAGILREWHEYVPIEPLFAAMQDADDQIRVTVKWTLAEAGVHIPAERLLPYLVEQDPLVREAVLSALGTRAPLAAVLEALPDPAEDLREAMVSLVGLFKEEIPVEPLIHMLRMGDASLRATAARALRQLGERIPVEPLSEVALHDEEVDVRLEAIRALSDTGNAMPVATLRPLLADPDQTIRWAVEKALIRAGDAEARALIVEGLHADHEWERENALIRLLESTDTEVHEIARQLPRAELLHLLKDQWWPVGHMAARLLAALGEQAPFAELLALLDDPLPLARWAALATLSELSEQLPLEQYIPLEPVLSALESEDVETQQRAAVVLDCFESQVPIDKLLSLLDEEEDVRIADILARRGRPEGRDVLVASLRTKDQAWSAAIALADIGEHAPAEPLLAALSASDRSVRSVVAETLYKTHPELLPRLVPELIQTLCTGEVGPLLEPLQHILLVQALAVLRTPQPALLAEFERLLTAPSWEVRMWAALGLGHITLPVPEPTLEKLQRLLHDPESTSVREIAQRALENLLPHTKHTQHE